MPVPTGQYSNVSFEYFPYQLTDRNVLWIVLISFARSISNGELMRELNLLNVAEDVLYRPFNTLSHGEQTKVLLAARFLKENSFLLIDEPTNHLDMNARKLVSDYLKSKRGYILVSHDRAFLDNCIDHILSINKANIEIQKGNLTSWWKNKAGQDVYFILVQNSELRVSLRAF